MPPQRQGMLSVSVGEGSTVHLTAPLNGSNLDYSGLAQPFSSPEVISAIKAFQGGTLRYPGGTIANYWQWQTGSVDQPPSTSGGGKSEPGFVRSYGFTLVTLHQVLEESNAVPIFDLNVLTSNLPDQLQMLYRARSLGIPVRYVELGNEFYLSNSNYLSVFPTAASYAELVARWAPRVRAAFPGVEVAAVGSLPQTTPRERTWNQALLSIAGPYIDAVTLHDYPVPPLRHPSTSEVLASAVLSWKKAQRVIATIPARYHIWVTEFNLSKRGLDQGNPPLGETWEHGLHVGVMEIMFDQSPRVQLEDYWDLFSTLLSGEFTAGQDPQITAAGSVLALLAGASRDASAVTPLSFNPEPRLSGGS
jgi:hypothetical protein